MARALLALKVRALLEHRLHIWHAVLGVGYSAGLSVFREQWDPLCDGLVRHVCRTYNRYAHEHRSSPRGRSLWV